MEATDASRSGCPTFVVALLAMRERGRVCRRFGSEKKAAANTQLAEATTYRSGTADVRSGPADTNLNGGGQQYDNLNPFLGLNYIIALQGVFPSRN